MTARSPHGITHRVGIAVGATATGGCAARPGEHCAPTAALPARFIKIVIANVVVRFSAGTDTALPQLVLHSPPPGRPPASTRNWRSASITDWLAAMNGLAAKVETALAEDLCCGHACVFRGWRGDMLKVLWWSGVGPCLLAT